MYLTIEETAKKLGLPIEQVHSYVLNGKIKSVHDGENYLINHSQFDKHYEQLEKVKEMIDEWRNTPIPDDIDVKDED
ncbi:excisionase family DNA-binding protein [Paenisporosarcina cavernae]|uniref:DNA-binding protein n=1 Tax=Paenisporosarcina cavernae TaxID=2320858 RepID=A0A385YSJ7_9BACL|nr:excisionase family DNA-binding protein [Paenisporosarcina cavernae]AYC28648.1 DNA-binding protein [Paenisporosarcina cavernae]